MYVMIIDLNFYALMNYNFKYLGIYKYSSYLTQSFNNSVRNR